MTHAYPYWYDDDWSDIDEEVYDAESFDRHYGPEINDDVEVSNIE